MNDKKSMKDYLIGLLTPEQKQKFSTAFKFDVATPAVVAPANPAVPPAATAPLTAPDGTEVKYDTPTPIAGVTKVTVVTPDGELPAPDGEITLSNGDVITVASGILTEIETAAASDVEPPMPNGMPMSVTKEAMDAAVNDVNAKLEKANKIIEALTSRFDSQAKEVTELKTAIVSFSTSFQELMGTPMAEPIEKPSYQGMKKGDKLLAKFAK